MCPHGHASLELLVIENVFSQTCKLGVTANRKCDSSLELLAKGNLSSRTCKLGVTGKRKCVIDDMQAWSYWK
jgi:hypothetical protein